MSTTSFFRRPTYRAPSPPTWACYEQIPYGSDDESESMSESDSDSDEDEEFARAADHRDDAEEVHNMDIDAEGDSATHGANVGGAENDGDVETVVKKDVKGKQRAVEPADEEDEPAPPKQSPQRERRKRERQRPTYNPRPILTIHKSQGFVWNQDLFVPPYIKDRYIASTSPPNAKGFIPGSCSSTDSTLGGYEVEVVDIRIKEGEFDDILRC